MNLKAWLKEFRVLFLLFVALPAVLGSAVAYATDETSFNICYCLLAVIAMMSLHAGTVISNDYFDFKSGTDVINEERTPYSGGSGLLPQKILRPGQVLAAGLLCFALSVAIGLFIVLTRSPSVLIVGIVGVAIGIFYTAPPFKLAYRGLGETARLVATPLIVLGAYLVQVPLVSAGDVSGHAWPLAIAFVSSLPVAFLTTAALYIFEFPDFAADSAVGKRNLVVKLGTKKAVYLFIVLSALAYLSIVAGVLIKALPPAGIVAFIALPFSALACAGLLKDHDVPKRLVPYLRSASNAYILATVVLIGAFIF